MKKGCLLTMAVLALWALWASVQGSAAERDFFSFRLDNTSVRQGDAVRLMVNANDLKGSVAGFLLTAEYSEDAVTVKKVVASEQLGSSNLRWTADGGRLKAVYVCDGVSAPNLDGQCVLVEFDVREDAEPGSEQIAVKMDQMVNWTEELYGEILEKELTVKIRPPLSSEALLDKLTPSVGELEPEFDPEIQEYEIQVDSAVDRMTFDLETQKNAAARINRTTLQKAGTATDFVITVISEDGKNRTQYVVTVHRALKPRDVSEPESEENGAEVPVGGAVETTPEESNAADSKTDASKTAASKAGSVSSKSAGKTGASKSPSTASRTGKDPEGEPEDISAAAVQNQPSVQYGDRILAISNGESQSSFQLWILISLVLVLIAVMLVMIHTIKQKKGE